MKRRSFLQMVGLAPFVGPKAVEQAVKETAATQAMQMAGMRILGGSDGAISFGSPSPSEDTSWAAPRLNEAFAAYAKLKALGRDRVVSKVRRRHGRGTFTLDPDLVASRSFSLATKMRIQRERDIQRRADDEFRQIENDITELKEIMGLA